MTTPGSKPRTCPVEAVVRAGRRGSVTSRSTQLPPCGLYKRRRNRTRIPGTAASDAVTPSLTRLQQDRTASCAGNLPQKQQYDLAQRGSRTVTPQNKKSGSRSLAVTRETDTFFFVSSAGGGAVYPLKKSQPQIQKPRSSQPVTTG